MALIAWFKDIYKESTSLVGGKGANLGEMWNAGFPIPPGFVITAEAYKEFIISTGIKDKILDIVDNLDVNDNEKLQKASADIQKIILEAEMPTDIKQEIVTSYDSLNFNQEVYKNASKTALSFLKAGRDLPFVAVRSSATAEDLPSISENEFVYVKLNNKPFIGMMKNLAAKLKQDDIVEVLAMDAFKVMWKKASDIYKHKVNGNKLYRISTSTGRKITISPNHTLIILNEETLEPEVSEIAHLKGNEKIPVVRAIPNCNNLESINVLDYVTNENVLEHNGLLKIKSYLNWKIQQGLPKTIKITNNFVYFMGIYAAEGTTSGENCIIITNSNANIIKKVRKAVKELGLNSENTLNKHSLRFYCKILARFLNQNCGIPNPNIKGKGKTCATKEVPAFLFDCSPELISEYLKACFDGDGCVDRSHVSYSSTSEKLIFGMGSLLSILGIEFYLLDKAPSHKSYSKSWLISIPSRELNKFKEKIGFLHSEKKVKLDNLIDNYNAAEKHFEFKNSISVSKTISNVLRDSIENNLVKSEVIASFCPLCFNMINKSSKYNGIERYYCARCKKAFYEPNIVKKNVKRYVNYDNGGRFLKNSVPWNKSINTYHKYGVNNFKKILGSANALQLSNVFSESIIWDEIINIEEVPYDSYVYDFTVPCVENFAAGFGNVITHNSASFAGQQATFLNIKGPEKVVKAVQECWASLFTARAIYYRKKNNFATDKVYIAVVVQKMVNSEKAGVMFTINPATNNEDEIIIEGAYGLGEAVVSGQVTPDEYIIDKKTLKIKGKKVKTQKWGYFRSESGRSNYQKTFREEKGSQQKTTDEEILKLARIGVEIERHYKRPMDIEWAVDGPKMYIVQARPVTTMRKVGERIKPSSIEIAAAEVILTGLAASPGIGFGKVKIVNTLAELSKVQPGDILVTKMTSPDMVPAMERAVAIVTDEGGLTSHASIVSREMGTPCVVGTEKATGLLKDNDEITVDGGKGVVYRGILNVPVRKDEKAGQHGIVCGEELITATKVYMNLGEPEKIAEYNDLPFDGIGLMRIEFIITDYVKDHPLHMIKEGRSQDYIDKLAEGISTVAIAIAPKPIIVRFSDFKTNEYANLAGGSEYEPKEENPMIGWRGISRYISEEFKPAFRLECKAIKKLRGQGLKNVHVMLPFVRTRWEVEKCLAIMEEEGLVRSNDFKIWLMAETPAIALIPEEFASLDIDGASIGSNDLTQGVLCIDRDSARLGKMGYFDERNPAVLTAIKRIITGFRKTGKTVSICGQAPSEYPEIVEFLIKNGITSISVNPDVVVKTRELVASIEKKIILEKIEGLK